MKIKHPDGGPTVETTREKAEPYLSQGWVEVQAKTTDASTDEKAK